MPTTKTSWVLRCRKHSLRWFAMAVYPQSGMGWNVRFTGDVRKATSFPHRSDAEDVAGKLPAGPYDLEEIQGDAGPVYSQADIDAIAADEARSARSMG